MTNDNSYDRAALYADALVRGIRSEMPDVAYFTREDLLHLSAFSMVATITRYNYIRQAVTHAIERGWIISVSRTQLILAGRKRSFLAQQQGSETYLPSVLKRVPYKQFHGSWLLDTWNTDEHLTKNAKRAILRDVLRLLVARKVLRRIDMDTYERGEDA